MAIHATERYFRRQPAKRLLTGVLVVVAGLTWWGWRSEPPSRLVGSQRVAGGTTISLPQDRHPGAHRAWSAELRLAGSQPGVRWSLHEGKNPGEGYELHWMPELPGLALWRAPRAFLLGSVRLDGVPRRITWTRAGALFAVAADERTVLACLDPAGVPENPDRAAEPVVRAWSCRTDNTLGDALLTVQLLDAGRTWGADLPVYLGANPLLEAALGDESRQDRALLAVRHALALVQAERNPIRAGEALAWARIVVDPSRVLDRRSSPPGLPPVASATAADPLRALAESQAALRSDPAAGHLRLWLGLGQVQLALSSRRLAADVGGGGDPAEDSVAEVVATELGEMAAVARTAGNPAELPGILMSLLPGLARPATWRPDYPRDPREVLAVRTVWSRLLGEAAVMALRQGGTGLPPSLAQQLRLIAHHAGCQLARLGEAGHLALDADGFTAAPLPTPVDGPAWLTARWRAGAGADPGVDLIPPLPGLPGSPLAETLAQLEASAGLAPIGAVRMRQQILTAVDDLRRERDGGQQAIEGALQAAPAREARLAKAMVALWSFANARPELKRQQQAVLQAARRELVAGSDGGSVAPEEVDPVAFALVALIEARIGGEIEQAAMERRSGARWTVFDGGGTMGGLPLPRALAAYARLLDGQGRATDRIWLGDLHPSQALLAALTMQEVARAYEQNANLRGERLPRSQRSPAAAAADPSARARAAPDWALLRRMPCLTLPAELLIPADASEPGAGGAGETGPLPP